MLIDSKTGKKLQLTRKRYVPYHEDSMMPHIPSTMVIRRGKKFIDLKKVAEAGAESGRNLRRALTGK